MSYKHGSYDGKMKKESLQTDVVVIGGGLAGMCAAISASRCGAGVVLIQDRAILGGNQSSEMQVGISGADCSGGATARYARETGILEEIWLEHMHRNPVYAAAWNMQDVLFWEAVNREKNIRLLLNTSAIRANTGEDGRIVSVEAVQASTEKEFLIEGSIFIDCSGDCRIGADAGAEFRIGREARAEFQESMAPEVGDDGTMGSSIFFNARRMDHKVPFERPEWAYEFPNDEDLPFRTMCLDTLGDEDQFTGFWWLEHGGCLDTIEDNERIRDELYKIVFGVWDHMKNHGDHGVDNYAIVWMNTLPAKRESRRLVGDYTVTENDVRNAPLFEDRVAYAGWPIDVHPPLGIFSKDPPCTSERLSDVWSIPFRSLYSKNIPNLMMAGRNISVTRIALGSARVMGTCAVMGQAVGTAAGLCVSSGILPRQLGAEHMDRLQQELLKNDCYIKDLENRDEKDLARGAGVTASGSAKLKLAEGGNEEELTCPAAQLVPVSGGRLDGAELLLRAEKPAQVTLRVWQVPRINAFPDAGCCLTTTSAEVPAGDGDWIRFELDLNLPQNTLIWLEVLPAEGVFWFHDEACRKVGVRSVVWNENQKRWNHRKGCSALRVLPDSMPYAGENVLSGVARPEKWTNLWISDPECAMPQYIQLDFQKEVELNQVMLTFDSDLDTNIYLPEPWGVFGIGHMPTCVRDYDVEVWSGEEWITVCSQRGNYLRHRVHDFETVKAEKLRVQVLATNGDPSARIYEIRCYKN